MGWDFAIDHEQNVWFLEANWNPDLRAGDIRERKILKYDLLQGMFDILVGLVRSRMKRIITFINKMTEAFPEGRIPYSSVEKYREMFNKISRNYFEPEYDPGVNPTFKKIIDENLEGVGRYAGLIEPECL